MELRLGFRLTLVMVILALTLFSQRVEAQRAGMIMKLFDMTQGWLYIAWKY